MSRVLTLITAIPLVIGAVNAQPARTALDCKSAAAQTPLEHLKAAECLATNKQWPKAEEHFRLARQSPELSEAAIVGHAKVLFHLNHPFDAMLELEDFLKTHPDSVPALHLLGTLLSGHLQDIARSLQVMERCSQLAPDDPDVWQYLGNLYLLERRDEDASRCFERAVRLRPGDAYSLASLAYATAHAGTVENAETRFEEALKLNTGAAQPNVMVWLMYGKFLLEQRRWTESLSIYDQSLKLASDSSEAYYGRAVAHENLKNFAQAEADALAAIRTFPTPRKDAYMLLIRLARIQKDRGKVDKYVNVVAEIDAEEEKRQDDSRERRALLFKAEPLFMQGKYAEAAVAYEELVKRAPLFYEAHFALGMCYAQTAQLAKAEEAFRKYLALQPLSADGHASLGLVLLQHERLDEAKSELARAVDIDPEMLEARKSLARIHAASSDPSKALALLTGAPNPETEWDEEYYVLLVNCAVGLRQLKEALAFCDRGTARFPGSDQLTKACGSLK